MGPAGPEAESISGKPADSTPSRMIGFLEKAPLSAGLSLVAPSLWACRGGGVRDRDRRDCQRGRPQTVQAVQDREREQFCRDEDTGKERQVTTRVQIQARA